MELISLGNEDCLKKFSILSFSISNRYSGLETVELMESAFMLKIALLTATFLVKSVLV